VGGIVHGSDGEGDEQALDLVAGERYEALRCRLAGVLIGSDDSEEGMGEHGEGDPARPGHVPADLVLVQGGQALAGLEELLNRPPLMPVKRELSLA
jgi:hypothetical protein